MKYQKCVKLKHQNDGISCNDVHLGSHSAILNNGNNEATCIMSLPFFPVASAPIRRTCLWFVMGEHNKIYIYPWPGALLLICILGWSCNACSLVCACFLMRTSASAESSGSNVFIHQIPFVFFQCSSTVWPMPCLPLNGLHWHVASSLQLFCSSTGLKKLT